MNVLVEEDRGIVEKDREASDEYPQQSSGPLFDEPRDRSISIFCDCCEMKVR